MLEDTQGYVRVWLKTKQRPKQVPPPLIPQTKATKQRERKRKNKPGKRDVEERYGSCLKNCPGRSPSWCLQEVRKRRLQGVGRFVSYYLPSYQENLPSPSSPAPRAYSKVTLGKVPCANLYPGLKELEITVCGLVWKHRLPREPGTHVLDPRSEFITGAPAQVWPRNEIYSNLRTLNHTEPQINLFLFPLCWALNQGFWKQQHLVSQFEPEWSLFIF